MPDSTRKFQYVRYGILLTSRFDGHEWGGVISANEGGHADTALVRRFRQAQTRRERTAAFADVVRQHRDAVLCSCAARLWPDADAAVAAAGDVLLAARAAMADSAKLPRPDRLRAWLLGIAAQGHLRRGASAGIDDINWEAVHRIADDVPEMPDLPARLASLRHLLEQIVLTLPEPRQRMYDLFVARGLDSRNAALELGTTVAEVRRLRRENRQAILRAFEVTALAATEAALDVVGGSTPGCGELRQILADAQLDGDPHEDRWRHTVVLPAALRLTVSRHLSQCGSCQDGSDDCMARWAPELLSILAGAELYEQVMDDAQLMPELRQPGPTPGAHRRVAPVRTVRTGVVRRAAVAAAGAGLLAALLLLAFVWPGFAHLTQASAALSSQDLSTGHPNGSDTPQVTGTFNGVPDNNHGRPVPSGAAGLLNSLPPVAAKSSAAASPASLPPSVYYTVQPSVSPTSSAVQPTSVRSTTSSPAAPSPSVSSPQPKTTSIAPSSAPATSSPTTSPPSPAPSTTSPAPSAAPSTAAPTTAAPTTAAPSAAPSTPAPTTPAPSPSPSSATDSPTASPSAPAPSASATS